MAFAATPSFASRVRVAWGDGHAETVRLRPIGKSGGAGEVFDIEGRPDLVAKLYHASTRKDQLAHYDRKLGWMVRNRPELPPIPPQYRNIVQLAWPVALVRANGGFAGFVMEKIDFARTMEVDYLLTRRQAAAEGFDADYGKLVTICYNLATLIGCLHSMRTAVVDLKPINLKFYKSELYVSILDCDGFHITSGDFISAATQVTPEYLAPEFQDRAVSDPQRQDWFALSAIIFRLLNYGIHPYAGVARGLRNYPAELAGRIKLGLYPFGIDALREVRAPPASVHECLPGDIRALFDRAFGRVPAQRAGVDDWIAVLGTYARGDSSRMTRCASGHLHFAGQRCATCLREGILSGHVARQKRFVTRIKASPARAVSYVRRSLQGTRSSPFQAALAQAQFNSVQMAPVTLPLRNILSVEIVWTLGLLITYWWLK